jgi:PhnB protein
MKFKPVPQGYHTATPYLIIKNAARAIDFYKNAFGAQELLRFEQPGGKIGHAEIKIGDSPIMLADEYPEMGYRSPETIGGTAVSILLYVDDVDKFFTRALGAGAKQMKPVNDMFWGDRCGTLADPFGHIWSIATHKEAVAPDEMRRRFQEMMKQEAAK